MGLIRRIRERGEPVAIGVLTAADHSLLDEAAALRPDAIFRKPADVPRMLAWLKLEAARRCR
jgi:hypothetical protein